jgi:DNA-binding response OmpR family regulator
MTAQDQLRFRVAALLRWVLVVSLAVSMGLFTGCKKQPQRHTLNQAPDQSADVTPEEAEVLAQLTGHLRRTMHRKQLSGSFEEFAEVRSDLTIPPPPAGKKYAISKSWKVVLVDQ